MHFSPILNLIIFIENNLEFENPKVWVMGGCSALVAPIQGVLPKEILLLSLLCSKKGWKVHTKNALRTNGQMDKRD